MFLGCNRPWHTSDRAEWPQYSPRRPCSSRPCLHRRCRERNGLWQISDQDAVLRCSRRLPGRRRPCSTRHRRGCPRRRISLIEADSLGVATDCLVQVSAEKRGVASAPRRLHLSVLILSGPAPWDTAARASNTIEPRTRDMVILSMHDILDQPAILVYSVIRGVRQQGSFRQISSRRKSAAEMASANAVASPTGRRRSGRPARSREDRLHNR